MRLSEERLTHCMNGHSSVSMSIPLYLCLNLRFSMFVSAAGYGILCIAMAFVASQLGDVLQVRVNGFNLFRKKLPIYI